MAEGIIFDLDDTLVDTECLRVYRDRRAWREAIRCVDETSAFPGVADLLSALRMRGVPWAIVTSSVSAYAEAVIAYHGLGPCPLIAFHDAPPKPNPQCITSALKLVGLPPEEAIGVGDQEVDLRSYRSAGVRPVGAGWSPRLMCDGWITVVATPVELLSLL